MDHAPGFLAIVDDAKRRIRECTVDEVIARAARGERGFLIDVREDREWAQGRAAGAIHLGRGILERDVERLIPDPDAPIVLYCGGGFRSALAADNLGKMGYTRVLSMAGGFKEWVRVGGAVDR